jgi:hypothetical protein
MGLDLQLAWDVFVYTVLCMAIYHAEPKSPVRCPHTQLPPCRDRQTRRHHSSSRRSARDTAPKTDLILLIPFQRDRLMCSLCMYHLPLFLLTSSLPPPRQYDSRNGSFRLRPSTSTHHEQL